MLRNRVSTASGAVRGNYLANDGLGMAETDLYRLVVVDLIEALTLHFAGQRVYAKDWSPTIGVRVLEFTR
jgi:hypothetical protein